MNNVYEQNVSIPRAITQRLPLQLTMCSLRQLLQTGLRIKRERSEAQKQMIPHPPLSGTPCGLLASKHVPRQRVIPTAVLRFLGAVTVGMAMDDTVFARG